MKAIPVELVAVVAQSDPDALLPARWQMTVSLGSHIVLACFGVAFPAMIFVVHRRGLRDDDPVALGLAQRWSKVAAVLFAIGAVSGTILSFEMGLLWPGLMRTYGDVLGLPFALEGIAFFIEAIFIGIYLYGWHRLPGRVHLAMLVPIAISGAVGTFCVLSVNAWMNNPTGFRVVDGEVVDVDPWAAMFNDAVWLMSLHMWVATFMVVGFSVAGVYAMGILRGRGSGAGARGPGVRGQGRSAEDGSVALVQAEAGAPAQRGVERGVAERGPDAGGDPGAGLALLTGVPIDGEFAGDLLVPLLLIGVGFAPMGVAASIAALADVPDDDTGVEESTLPDRHAAGCRRPHDGRAGPHRPARRRRCRPARRSGPGLPARLRRGRGLRGAGPSHRRHAAAAPPPAPAAQDSGTRGAAGELR